MPEQLAETLKRLDGTLSALDETLRTAQVEAAKAAADAAWAAQQIAKEKWWRRTTWASLLLIALLAGIGIVDTRMDQARNEARKEAEEYATCLRGNDTRTNIRGAIVASLDEVYAISDGGISETERLATAAVEDRVRREIPLRECE